MKSKDTTVISSKCRKFRRWKCARNIVVDRSDNIGEVKLLWSDFPNPFKGIFKVFARRNVFQRLFEN